VVNDWGSTSPFSKPLKTGGPQQRGHINPKKSPWRHTSRRSCRKCPMRKAKGLSEFFPALSARMPGGIAGAVLPKPGSIREGTFPLVGRGNLAANGKGGGTRRLKFCYARQGSLLIQPRETTEANTQSQGRSTCRMMRGLLERA